VINQPWVRAVGSNCYFVHKLAAGAQVMQPAATAYVALLFASLWHGKHWVRIGLLEARLPNRLGPLYR